MTIPNPARAAAFFERISILPRRLWLETPGVEATVPMLRGTWGAALHDLDNQVYQEVFGGEDSQDAPPGYLLRPAPPDPRCAPAVDFFLFGQAIQHDAACRRAWHEAAQRGLGPKRRPFRIRGTFVLGPTGSLKEEPLVPASGTRECAGSSLESAAAEAPRVHEIAALLPAGSRLPLAGADAAAAGAPAAAVQGNGTRSVPATMAWPLSQAVWPFDRGAPCRIVFNAPLRLRRRGSLIEQPNLADIVVAACRRIAAFLPEALRDDWKNWSAEALESARDVPHSTWQGARLDLHRWSARQQSELDLHGVVGCLELREGPGELAPLLAAARWLHLGKATVMGLGQFEVTGT